MNEIKQLGNVLPKKIWKNPTPGRVYDTSGLAPTLTNLSGGGSRQPHVIVAVKKGKHK